jgi:hypothetical protein
MCVPSCFIHMCSILFHTCVCHPVSYICVPTCFIYMCAPDLAIEFNGSCAVKIIRYRWLIRGRCCDHNFRRFFAKFSARKCCFSQKTILWPFFAQTRSSLSKNAVWTKMGSATFCCQLFNKLIWSPCSSANWHSTNFICSTYLHMYLPVKTRLLIHRVTRLGEFSPNGQLLTLGSSLKLCTKSSPHFRATSTRVYIVYICINFDKNWVGLFWAIYSQTRLVTLLLNQVLNHFSAWWTPLPIWQTRTSPATKNLLHSYLTLTS